MLIKSKIHKGIKFKNIEQLIIIYRKEDCSINPVQRLVLASLKKLEKFYGIKPPFFKLEFIYSRDEFNRRVGWKTPEWFVGINLKNKIFLFSPLIIEKYSSHRKSSLRKIINHEICHLFNKTINKNILNWVDEGTALLLSEQEKPKNFKESDWRFFINNFATKNINYRSFCEHGGYKISYWAARMIAEKFNRKRLLDLIKINSKRKNIRKKMERIFGMPLQKFLRALFLQKKPLSTFEKGGSGGDC